MSGATDLEVTIPACLASGAHQLGESSLVLFEAARALDRRGSGRVQRDHIRDACRTLFSSRQFGRILADPASARYWKLEERFLQLRSEAAIVKSYPKDRLVLGRGDYHSRPEPLLYGWKPVAPRTGASLTEARITSGRFPGPRRMKSTRR